MKKKQKKNNILTELPPINIYSEIEKEICKNKFIFLVGAHGSGKTRILHNYKKQHKNLEKKHSIFFYKCISNRDKRNENQICDYDSFLSNILTEYYHKWMTGINDISEKERIVKSELIKTDEKKVFIFDDFDQIKIDDMEKIITFLSKNFFQKEISVIVTSNKMLECYKNNIDNINFFSEVKINNNNTVNIYIESCNIKKTQEKLVTLRKSLKPKVFDDFIIRQCDGNFYLIREIQNDLCKKILNCNNKNIKHEFKNLKFEYPIQEGKLLREELKKIQREEIFYLQALSFFKTPISCEILDEIVNQQKKFENIYVYLSKNNPIIVDYIYKENDKFYLDTSLKSLLEEEREKNKHLYEEITKNWIAYYKEYTQKKGEGFDNFETLEELTPEFDNISELLDYCYNNHNWSDYYDISNNIKYFCYLKGKSINEYQYKRIVAARELNNNEKLFDALQYYYCVACKMNSHTSSVAIMCFEELNKLKSKLSEIDFIKYRYVEALRDYVEEKYELAQSKFEICEKKLTNFFDKQKEKEFYERKIKRDYVTTIKWLSICFYESISNGSCKKEEKDYEKLFSKIEIALTYANHVDFLRAKAYLLMYQIKLYILYDIEKNIIINKFNELRTLQEKIIKKDPGYEKKYEELKEELLNHEYIYLTT